MKKIFVVMVFFLFLLQVSAQDDYFNYQTLLIDLSIKNNLSIVPKSGDYFAKSVKASLSYYPKESYRQAVQETAAFPEPELENDRIIFFWDNPADKISFESESIVKTSAEFSKVHKKEEFPIQGINASLYTYIQQGEIIDITPEIENIASSLAEGKTDLYEVVFELARWTEQNIEYNLSTRNIEASQKASWVLENREGVCDEITSLFIAMCRSLGIPARFVSGIAYTNAEVFGQDWGPHGWAEVYFPETGWVPFDVTYGEFGYIDAGHITLSRSNGPKDSSAEYEYTGWGIGLDTGKLVFETDVLEKGQSIEKIVDFDINLYSKSVGFGSYNMVAATVKNSNEYYVSQKFFLAKTQGITILDEYEKTLLLKPGEEKKVRWIIKVDQELDPRSIYTFPVKIYTNRGQEAKAEFQAMQEFLTIPYSELEKYSEELAETSKPEISLLCEPKKYEIYYYESTEIECRLEKFPDANIGSIDICIDKGCNSYNMKGISNIEFSFEKSFDELGLKNIPVTASYGSSSKTNYIVINVVDEPDLYIANIESPGDVRFEKNFSIVFILKRKSQSLPRNISVLLVHDKDIIRYGWDFDLLDSDQKFVLNSDSRMLWPGKNRFTLFIEFQDAEGKKFNQSKQFSLDLVETTVGQKAYLLLNRIGGGIERIISNKYDREKFFKSPKTWIIVIGAVVILAILEAIIRIEKKRGRYAPHPHIPGSGKN